MRSIRGEIYGECISNTACRGLGPSSKTCDIKQDFYIFFIQWYTENIDCLLNKCASFWWSHLGAHTTLLWQIIILKNHWFEQHLLIFIMHLNLSTRWIEKVFRKGTTRKHVQNYVSVWTPKTVSDSRRRSCLIWGLCRDVLGLTLKFRPFVHGNNCRKRHLGPGILFHSFIIRRVM